MSGVSEEKYLSEIAIPGTHDSGSYDDWYKTSFGKCQNLDIKEQLAKGIRFLDIRCRVYKNKLWIVHNFTDRSIDLDSVLRDCLTLFKKGDDETIIMSIKQDYIGAFENKEEFYKIFYNNYYKPNEHIWFTENDIPKLKDIKHKIVLLRRFINYNDSELGIEANQCLWQDNKTFCISHQNFKLHIQDHYNVSNEQIKFSDITSVFNDARENSDNKNWYFNFTSGYISTLGIPSVKALSDPINEKLNPPLTNSNTRGVVIMDFLDESNKKVYDNSLKIINSNLKPKDKIVE